MALMPDENDLMKQLAEINRKMLQRYVPQITNTVSINPTPTTLLSNLPVLPNTVLTNLPTVSTVFVNPPFLKTKSLEEAFGDWHELYQKLEDMKSAPTPVKVEVPATTTEPMPSRALGRQKQRIGLFTLD